VAEGIGPNVPRTAAAKPESVFKPISFPCLLGLIDDEVVSLHLSNAVYTFTQAWPLRNRPGKREIAMKQNRALCLLVDDVWGDKRYFQFFFCRRNRPCGSVFHLL
jgi:hypothetical protein